MEYAKDPNFQNQQQQPYPPQPFVGQGVPIGSADQMQYGGYQQHPMPPPQNPYPQNPYPNAYQPYNMPPPPIIAPGNIVIVGNSFCFR